MKQPLAINGLLMPDDFPIGPFERTYARARLRAATQAASFEHFTAAWNAVSFRFVTMGLEGDAFTESITAPDGQAAIDQRIRQERHLFGFFSNGFSAFESYFYGMYAIGAILQPAEFPLASAKDQQSVSPLSTDRAFTRTFIGDHILPVFQATFADAAYREWKEVRNVLTHRTAPGRTIFVSIGADEDLAARWRLCDIPLNDQTAPTRRTHVARLLTSLLDGAVAFVESRIV